MKTARFVTFGLLVFVLLCVWSPQSRAVEIIPNTATQLTHAFWPSYNTYHFWVTLSDNTILKVGATFAKSENRTYMNLIKETEQGQKVGKFFTETIQDPVLYDFPCSFTQEKKAGSGVMLPGAPGSSQKNICWLVRNAIPAAKRAQWRGEYEAATATTPKTPPLIIMPVQHRVTTVNKETEFLFRLPFRVYRPCQEWSIRVVMEKETAVQGGGTEFKPFLHQEFGTSEEYEDTTCQCKASLTFMPGKFRYKVYARRIDGHKTDLTPEYYMLEVNKQTIAITDPAKVMAAVDPWIKVTKPTAWVRWKKGETHYIRWNSLKVPGKVDVFLATEGGISERITPEGGVNASVGYWRWTPGTDIPPGIDYRILVVSKDDETVRHMTQYTFAIVMKIDAGNRGKKLTLKEPQGGETWKSGLPYTILWGREGIKQGARVKVELFKGGQLVKTISPAAGLLVHSGKTTFEPGPEIPWARNYQIKISIKGSPDIMDRSENFTIIPWVGAKKTGQQYGASVHTTAGKSKALLPAIKTVPMFKIKLSGKSFRLPAKITPLIKFASADRLSHFEVQKSTGPGRWTRPTVFKTKTFTITKIGTYRYRAVGQDGLKSSWDSFMVKAPLPTIKTMP